ncbi:hypothetical protein BT93_I0573 [Corymbia citriodora subsp. variegata]|nr:hypothetical protein BT93_I0573 [Corymbia citriodora subsp. variegata]
MFPQSLRGGKRMMERRRRRRRKLDRRRDAGDVETKSGKGRTGNGRPDAIARCGFSRRTTESEAAKARGRERPARGRGGGGGDGGGGGGGGRWWRRKSTWGKVREKDSRRRKTGCCWLRVRERIRRLFTFFLGPLPYEL